MASCQTYGPGELMRCPGQTYQGPCGKGLGWVGAACSAVVCADAAPDPAADMTRKCTRCQAIVSITVRRAQDAA